MKPLTELERRRQKAGLELVKFASTTKSLVRRRVSAGQATTISKEEGKRIDEWLKQHKHIIYGSLPTRQQMFQGRVARDIDLAVKNPRASAYRIKHILDTEPNFPYPTRIIKSPGGRRYAVQVKKNGKWTDAADIHQIGMFFGNYDVYGSTLPPYEQNGLKAQTLTDQLLRKANSVMTRDAGTGKFGPKSEREIKDTADFINTSRMLVSSAEVRAHATLEQVKRAKQAIRVWESHYQTIKGRKQKILKNPVSSEHKRRFVTYSLDNPEIPIDDIVFTSCGLKPLKLNQKRGRKVKSPYSKSPSKKGKRTKRRDRKEPKLVDVPRISFSFDDAMKMFKYK